MAGLLCKDFEGVDDFSLLSLTPFIIGLNIKWVFPMIGHYQSWHVDLISWLPCVVAIWVPFPFDEVLKTPLAAIKTVINDGLDLVFLSIFDQFWGWPHVVDPVLCHFTIEG
jgi:hypothetical protein